MVDVAESESEFEFVPDSELDLEDELGLASLVLVLLVSFVAEAPEELGVGELSLLGVVVVAESFREQPKGTVRESDRIGTNSASARPAAEIRDVDAGTRTPKQESLRRSSRDFYPTV